MIQVLPNELQIEILTYVITETSIQKFCTLRTVCKRWNAFVPLVMHKEVISRLNSGLKLELTYFHGVASYFKSIQKLSPTYDDFAKTFTFVFDDTDDNIGDTYYDVTKLHCDYNVSLTVSVWMERSKDRRNKRSKRSPSKLGNELGVLTLSKLLNNDIYKHEFDHRSNICFKREVIKINEDNDFIYVKLHSFTLEAWKLCYILDYFEFDT
ncbi:5544_t:CDS:2 [Cetraspora pellucida]|uniref:5544_t:CDS:1 n=1 Tax=Cetraspora pellucida TaxID=1433469 RepID=A0A9N9D537_9GLOM|nr:5544_t:CDS:2 [Cetraspora pellucida]